jgi:hypothetical protein
VINDLSNRARPQPGSHSHKVLCGYSNSLWLVDQPLRCHPEVMSPDGGERLVPRSRDTTEAISAPSRSHQPSFVGTAVMCPSGLVASVDSWGS